MTQVTGINGSSRTNTGGHAPSPSQYHVHKGDTLSGIAARHGVSLGALERANPGIAGQRFIFPGDKLTIPASSGQASGQNTASHTIQRGETLSSIAAKHGTSVDAIARANPGTIKNVNHIYPGDTIVIPSGGKAEIRQSHSVNQPKFTNNKLPQPVRGNASTQNTNHRLGALSEVYESGGRGPGTVSSGRNDPGGVSYGVYQLSSTKGTLSSFMRNEGARWSPEFAGMLPGSRAFNNQWEQIAKRQPEVFRDAQHAFIERSHYKSVVGKVASDTGLNFNTRHNAVRDAVWSVSVQHGGAVNILKQAIILSDSKLSRSDLRYDKALVQNIYNERTKYVLNLATNNKSLSAGERSQLINITKNRYPKELSDAMSMFDKGALSVPTIISSPMQDRSAAYVNPTGQGIRSDSGGHGNFGASRVRKGRQGSHEGLDILSTPGQSIKAPISGRLEISNPQNVHSGFKIIASDGKTIVKVFYAKYDVSLVGKQVNAGDVVATAQDLQMQNKYPKNVKDHVHIEVIKDGKKIDPAPLLFPK